MLKCQRCDQAARHHVTEVAAGKPHEYHLCPTHLQDYYLLPPPPQSLDSCIALEKFWKDSNLGKVLQNPAVRQEMAARLLPALCLALLHQKPEVRTAAVFRLMQLGTDARSAIAALQDTLKDSDERVASAAQIALGYIQSEQREHVLGIAHPKHKYDRGDRVKIRDGHLAGKEGEVKDILDAKGMVSVELTLFGRPMLVELEYWQVSWF